MAVTHKQGAPRPIYHRYRVGNTGDVWLGRTIWQRGAVCGTPSRPGLDTSWFWGNTICKNCRKLAPKKWREKWDAEQ